MTAQLDLLGRSCPTLAAARHFGIPAEFAFLLGDMALRAVCPRRGVWPEDHHWHIWATAGADQAAGPMATRGFVLAMADLYASRYPEEATRI